MQVIIAAILAIGIGCFGEIECLQYPLKELGQIFINLLKMVIVPIAFVSIAGAIIKLGGDIKGITARAFCFATFMSAIGVIIGLAIMCVIGISPLDVGESIIKDPKSPTVLEFINNCIPKNPIESFAKGDMLQVITCSFFIGIASLFLKEKKSILSAFDIMQKICMKISALVLKVAPIGVFALLYPVVAKGNILTSYLSMVGALIIGSVLFTLICSYPLLKFCGVESPLKFLRIIIKQDVVGAISGGASNYMAPRIDLLKKNTNISHAVIDYLTPLLSVLMRTGSCICVGIYTYFASSIYGVELTPDRIIVTVLIAVIALMAAPGIIGGTLMDCAIIWSAIGVPIEAIALLAGIDYIMDLLRTVLNIQGGEIVTACVDKLETVKNKYC